ncbi:TetR family transcriptional regulator [Marinobacterium mangrovicola]|uniref:TetR family transcriptional regulator n=2 Tax=Marinobacterium mangrovicola TaxID=1476959 RepID=A0A4R1GC37_9GAMM|nr:TetR family transcriptional regulator [Marinobacterium mangrovicola]
MPGNQPNDLLAPHWLKMTTNKLSRDTWINAAIKVLATGGIDQVRVDQLAKKLKITRGSFYHHFDSRKDLLEGILKKWRLRATEEIIDRLQRGAASPLEQIIYLMNLPVKGSSAVEAASIEISIRAWARRDSLARECVEEVDNYRLSFIKTIFKELGHTDVRADDLANLVYAYIVSTSLIHFDKDYKHRQEMAERIAEFLVSNCPLMKCPKRDELANKP